MPLALDVRIDGLQHAARRVLDDLQYAEFTGADTGQARQRIARIAAELERIAASRSIMTEPVTSVPQPRSYGI